MNSIRRSITKKPRDIPYRRFDRFIPPISYEWALEAAASSRSGKMLSVAMLLWYRRAITGEKWFGISRQLLRDWHLSPKTYLRVLDRLEAAGLVRLHKSGRESTKVRIIDERFQSG